MQDERRAQLRGANTSGRMTARIARIARRCDLAAGWPSCSVPIRYGAAVAATVLALAADAQHLAMLRSFGFRAVVLLPLIARGRTLGAIWLGADSGRCCRPPDVALAQELAHRCALAIDSARLYQAAQDAIQVRDELLSATSHELRTPLSHIKGFVTSLLQTDVDWDEETRRDFLLETDREADRLARLIGDLLDMSRIESGGLNGQERAPVSLATLVTGGLSRTNGLLAEHPVLVDIPAELPPVNLDAQQFERVLVNLLDNAAKHSTPHSGISISAEVVDREVQLRVEDDGPGIPPDQLEHIFEKFFRARKSEDSGIPGTGLGLAICRGIVRAQGGRIWAENRPEGGARFTVALPLTVDVRHR
jgi:K+-sensing histidine kinase KdpD